MNLENSKFLFQLYDHCKDFRHFFLSSDYHNMFTSLYHILDQIIEIDNIGGIFYKKHQNRYEYFTVFPNDYDLDLTQFYQSLLNENKIEEIQKMLEDYLKKYQHVFIFPLCSDEYFYGYLYFCKSLNHNDFDEEERDLLKGLCDIYADIFNNKDSYQRKVFDKSIIGKILNSIHANVCITDPYTSDILYMNDKMKASYQLNDEVVGLKCYKVLKDNLHQKCQNCPVDYLLDHPDKCFMWEEINDTTHHIYQNYDSFIEWFDHSQVHLQYSVDITQIRQIQNVAAYDDLTGIYNRRFGKIQLSKQREMANQNQKNIVVCLFDLDHLKATNDAFGHQSGDQFIKIITDEVSKNISQEDVFLRLSGDEFVVSFYDMSLHQAHDKMDSILKNLKVIKTDKMIPYDLSFCYGMYEVTNDNQADINEIIHYADERMYTWKKRNHLKHAIMDLKVHSPIVDEFDYNKDLLYNALVKSTDDYIFICNMKTGVFKYTPQMVEEFDFPSEILNNAAAVFGAKIHRDDKYEFLNNNQQIIDGRTDSHIVEYRALNKNNEYVWLRCRGHVEYDENGEPSLFAGFISNLGRKNFRDALTGLYNQFEFEKRIEESTSDFAIMILNIRHFQAINQLYNREFGDNVLRIIAQNLETMLHKETSVFKLEGDEFGLIVKDYSLEHMNALFHKIQAFALQEHVYEGKPFTFSFNAGVAIFPQDGHNYLELRKNCEIALWDSRHNPQDILTFFEPDLLKRKTYRLKLLNCLKQSMSNHFEGFSLVFQPYVASKSHQFIGFEALIRWNHPDFPHAGPGFFIPLLEETGDIIQLGSWIFEQSLSYLEKMNQCSQSIFMSINVSYIQFLQDDFISFVSETLNQYDVSPQQIVIELTETAIAKNNDLIIPAIIKLQKLGFQIAMDDFGTGYSSLSLLRDEPLDIVKIDQAFVRDIKTDSYHYTFTKFMIELCHQLQLKVTIEGVETKEELDIIESFHPDYIQGYYIGKPMDIDQAMTILETTQDKKNS